MASLKFKGDITLDQVFNQHKSTIYDRLVEEIKLVYEDSSINEITVIHIELNSVEYSINLTRNKFISGLESAISFYENVEEYEKCQICLNIITQLKKENK